MLRIKGTQETKEQTFTETKIEISLTEILEHLLFVWKCLGYFRRKDLYLGFWKSRWEAEDSIHWTWNESWLPDQGRNNQRILKFWWLRWDTYLSNSVFWQFRAALKPTWCYTCIEINTFHCPKFLWVSSLLLKAACQACCKIAVTSTFGMLKKRNLSLCPAWTTQEDPVSKKAK